MAEINSDENKAAIIAFLENNDIDPNSEVDFSTKFETFYYVGEKRIFAEQTGVAFDLKGKHDFSVLLHEINNIEFVNDFRLDAQHFSYDEIRESLNITGTDDKYPEPYKVVVNSIYIEFI